MITFQKLATHPQASKSILGMSLEAFEQNLVNSGVTLEKVAMLLGHTSLNTTIVYTTPGLSDLEQAVRVLDG